MTNPLSLADLIALNDEIVALVKAGVPLERGLTELSGDLPGRLGRVTDRLGQRLTRGESLVQAVAAERSALPPLYGAVMQAGLRAGKLSAALEGLAATARRLAELRHLAGMALVYPLLVLFFAYFLGLFMLRRIMPAIATSFDDMQSRAAGFLRWLVEAGEAFSPYAKWPPLIVLILVAIWWWQSGRAVLLEPRWAGGLLGWIPWYGRLRRHSQAAAFCDVLALLVEHQTPLAEALPLAAEATGARLWKRAAQAWSDAVQRGVAPAESDLQGLPPLLRWLMHAGEERNQLAPALRRSAVRYRTRALALAELSQTYLPIVLMLVLGATVTVLYALVMFVPWTTMLNELTDPMSGNMP